MDGISAVDRVAVAAGFRHQQVVDESLDVLRLALPE